MNQTIFVICIIVITTAADKIIVGEQTCTCEQLKSQFDCNNNSDCQWNYANTQTCSIKSTPSTKSSVTIYCSTYTSSPILCAKREGCAYFQQKCTQFSGCSAYGQTNTADCQAISDKCVSNGQECIDIRPCPDYKTQDICTNSPSKSGRKKCIWENEQCREEQCQDATFNSNYQCNQFMEGCVSTGKWCVDELRYCSSYQGNKIYCEGLIGKEGKCEGGIQDSKCKAKICQNASQNFTTDQECDNYQIGCITNGKGCTYPPLLSCSFNQIDKCQGHIGSDGVCKLNKEGTTCISQVCEDASIEYKTDKECQKFKNQCITTGKGCTTKRYPCQSYEGTIISCESYIGADGYCKGKDQFTIQPCSPKVCSDAPKSYSTDEACNQFQIGCITNGKGCVTVLQPCSQYLGNKSDCEGLIGTDGKCKGLSSEIKSNCVPKLCSDAPDTFTNNDSCNSFQVGCVTNGNGCVEQQLCKNTLNEISCKVSRNCQWNGICVDSTDCTNFKSASICNNYTAGNQRKCIWTGISCRELQCTDAPLTYYFDGQCKEFRSDCLTNGNGCLSNTAPCSQYYGTQKQCSEYTRQCWNELFAKANTQCIERQCIHNTTANSDNECNSFKYGCSYNGQGCIESQKPCNAYQGNQAKCNEFKGNNGSIPCWNIITATNNTPCINKQCSHNTWSLTDFECNQFLQDCVSNGQGCISKTEQCSSYQGTQEQCSKFKGTNGTKECWFVGVSGKCIEKECFHAPSTLTTDKDCNIFMAGCVTNGFGCISDTEPCSSYTGTIDECSKFTGNGERCYNDAQCVDRECSDLREPQNNDECKAYHSNCRYFHGQCVQGKICSLYLGQLVNECQNVVDINLKKCWWTSGSFCTDRSCENAPISVTSQLECDNHISNCTYNGNHQCITRFSCSLYFAYGLDANEKLQNCKQMANAKGDLCWYSNSDTTFCTDRTCDNAPLPIQKQEDCDLHKMNCQFNGTSCQQLGDCTTYIVQGTNQQKLNYCKQMKNKLNQQCYWSDGNKCEDIKCFQAQNANSQLTCDTHLPNKCSYEFKCQTRQCNGKQGALNQTDCNNWKSGCQYNGGTSCIDKPINCSQISFANFINKLNEFSIKQVCESISTELEEKCQINESQNGCSTRTCNGARGMTSSSDCNNWLSNCQWDGASKSSCVDSTLTCSSVFPIAVGDNILFKKQFCESYTTSSLFKCQLKSDASGCENRTCEGATGMNSSSDCNNWKSNCQWDGVPNSSCVAQSSSCYYLYNPYFPPAVGDNIQYKKQFCLSYTTYSYPGRCQLRSDNSQCEFRTCAGATGMNSSSDCNNWLPTCQWDGVPNSNCVNQTATCYSYFPYFPSAVGDNIQYKKQFCLSYTTSTSYGRCQLKIDNSACEDRTCYGATGMNSSSDCNNWLPTCQWDGVPNSSCVAQSATCYSYFPYFPSAVGDNIQYKKQFCLSYTTSTSYGRCQLKIDNSACEDRTCYGATGMNSSSDCNNWLPTCQWDGVPNSNCVNQTATCYSYFPYFPSAVGDNIQYKKQFCLSFTTSTSSGRCQLKSDNSQCQYRTCEGATGMNSSSDCNNWLPTCQWDGVPNSNCVNQTATCYSYFPYFPSAVGDNIQYKKQFCLSYTTSTSYGRCQLKSDNSGCEGRTCQGATGMNSSSDCNNWLSNCQWDGVDSCEIISNICPSILDKQTSKTQKLNYCNNYITSGNSRCQLKSDTSQCESRTCKHKINAKSTSDCINWMSTCKYNGTPICIDQQSNCNSYIIPNSISTQQQLCETLTDFSMHPCQQGSTGCVDRTCANISNAQSNEDCNKWLEGCVYIGSGCAIKGSCTDYRINGENDDINRNLCYNLINTFEQACAYLNGQGNCVERKCDNRNPQPIDKMSCIGWLNKCRWTGSQCIDSQPCTAYSVSGQTEFERQSFCLLLQDNATPPQHCTYDPNLSTTFCSQRTCLNIPYIPKTNDDCQNYLSSCRISFTEPSAKCIQKEFGCSEFYGTKEQCLIIKAINDTQPCWSNMQTVQRCTNKICEHNTTAATDVQCEEFISGCKSNGRGCVSNSISCSNQRGNQETCSLRKSSDGINKCKFNQQISSKCRAKSCFDDVLSTSDEQCQAFMKSCITKGIGCIDKSEPCSSYRGNKQQCFQFFGLNRTKRCWSDQETIATWSCRDRQCQDDIQSESDVSCSNFQIGCVTKGKGCIDKKAPCGSYFGTQQQCAKFKGDNGTTPCWNLYVNSSSFCLNKECKHNTIATTDLECDSFIPKATGSLTPKCITNGAGCVPYPQQCHNFVGDTQKCGQFTAKDGPCKSTSKTGFDKCTPRLCSDASNTLKTDLECQKFYPLCVSNGYGCVVKSEYLTCSDILNSSACATKLNCKWVSSCHDTAEDCLSLTPYKASICTNTALLNGSKNCSWKNNECIESTCADLSDELNSHEACNFVMSSCTTKGQGCIEIGACSTYETEIICLSAYATDFGNSCIWSDNRCRGKQCSDATRYTYTDSGCQKFLSGCRTNGKICITSEFSCSSLLTESVCIRDSSSRPCLWVQNSCHNYSNCEDINKSTHEECQEFSSQCTSDGVKCVSIRLCSLTTLKISCRIGRDGVCGWLPQKGYNLAGKCQKFNNCIDALLESTEDCQQFGSECVSDGVSCIPKSTCSSYQTQISCESGGIDGACAYDNGKCRLRKCSDATAETAQSITTHEGCYHFQADTKCTTSGSECIPLAQCSSYTNEPPCQIGLDGACIWSQDKCRTKVCSDFKLKTNSECQKAYLEGVCNSNGTNCIEKDYCSKYVTRESCHGGGLDGGCVFTSTSTSYPNVGVCKLFAECSDADNDEVACKSKAEACNWTITVRDQLIQTLCESHTCSTIAVGTNCKPISNFEGTSYQICVLRENECVKGERSSFNQQTCNSNSMNTYTWNEQTNECVACYKTSVPDIQELLAETQEDSIIQIGITIFSVIAITI